VLSEKQATTAQAARWEDVPLHLAVLGEQGLFFQMALLALVAITKKTKEQKNKHSRSPHYLSLCPLRRRHEEMWLSMGRGGGCFFVFLFFAPPALHIDALASMKQRPLNRNLSSRTFGSAFLM